MRGGSLKMADLFCGAGGTSTGAVEAMELLGYDANLTAINHWPVAIATHALNHPNARHLCTGLDSVNPRELFREGELDFLWASPECTHHSRARGGKPIKDQSRSTAWCVIRWAEALRPNVILVENVPEFRDWGPVDSKGKIIKKRKGEIFESWLNNLRAIGYKVEYRIFCAGDYGDPTSRERLFVQAVRGKRRVVWPHATHPEEGVNSLSSMIWKQRVARDAVDLSVKGKLLTERSKPLSPKTMRRILAGFFKQLGVKADLDSYIVPNFGEREGQSPRVHDLDKLMPAVTGRGAGNLITPYLIEFRGTQRSQLDASGKSLDGLMGTVTAGGIHNALIEPMAMEIDHQSNPKGVRPVSEKVSTVTVKQRHALVQAEPMVIPQHSSNKAKSLDGPAPTVTITSRGIGLAIPDGFVIQVNHGNGKEGGKGDLRRVKGLDDKMPAICRKNGHAVVKPMVLGQQSGSVARTVDEAVPTVSGAGAIAVVEPYLVHYYGTGGSTPISKKVPTVTAKDRHAIVLPVITYQDGTKVLVDFHFRMFMPRELAASQGFRADYRFSGNNTEQVAQIGNAVPRRLARALCLAVLSQESDISRFIAHEEVGREVAA